MEKTALCILFDRSINKGCPESLCEVPLQLDREKKYDRVVFYFVGKHEYVARQYESFIQKYIRNMTLVTFKRHMLNSSEDIPMVRRANNVDRELEHIIDKYNITGIYAYVYDKWYVKSCPLVEVRAIEEVCRNHRPLIKDGKIYGCDIINKHDWIGIYYDK